MSATVHKLPLSSPAKLECSACGATTDAACQCAKPYVPAGLRAAQALAAHPEKSDRVIAAELGVNHSTVTRTRNKSTVADATVDRRIGRDGKARRLPQRVIDEANAAATGEGIEDEVEPEHRRAAFLLRADQAIRFASYTGPADKDVVRFARRVVEVWSDLLSQLEKSK